MAYQHIILPNSTTSGATPNAWVSGTTEDGIKDGELAINLYPGKEFLVTRNNGNVVKFSSDNQDIFEKGNGIGSVKQKGSGCIANGDYSFAMGFQSSATTFYAHADGHLVLASGGFSHAEGSRTTADGTNSHAEGDSTTASGSTSHAEGKGTRALGDFSHAEGSGATAEGNASHAEGKAVATGQYSHAEGNGRTSGTYAHAEGSGEAHGSGSHAEGKDTLAYGQGAHTEGDRTSATTSYAHAEGIQTLADGAASHAEGKKTKAMHVAEHASGLFNVSHNSGATEWDDLQGISASTSTVEAFTGTSTLFSVGFGEDSATTRNAFEITDKGQVVLNSRKTYFRYGDTSAAIGDNDFAATGATQYPEQDGVAEYITMFDIIEDTKGSSVFEKGTGANSVQQKGSGCIASGGQSGEFACGYWNESTSDTIFSVGAGIDVVGNDPTRKNAIEVQRDNQLKSNVILKDNVYVSGDTVISGNLTVNGGIKKRVLNGVVSTTTGSTSLSAITNAMDASTEIIYVNNTVSGGNNHVVYISSGNTMTEGQKVTLYFASPMTIGDLVSQTNRLTQYNVKFYLHLGGRIDLYDGQSMVQYLANYSFTQMEIIKIVGNVLGGEFIITLGNVKDLTTPSA